MHYHAEVWVASPEDVDTQVAVAMAPHQEDDTGGFWDWYQIGGRYSGLKDGYDPEADPRNIEVCPFCNGTGDRPEMVYYETTENGEQIRCFVDDWARQCNGCNACIGKGVRAKWPTQWVQHEGDVIPVSEVSDDLTCFTLIVGDTVLHIEDGWNRETFEPIPGPMAEKTVKQALTELDITDGYLVTVDYHC